MEQDTLFHLIALGDKASDTLLRLRSDLGGWFDKELLSGKNYNYLVVLADDNTSPEMLPKADIDDETGKLKVFVIDISDKPRTSEWANVLSYIWIPSESQYDTVKKLFRIVYHDSLYIHSLISFDFNDWKNLVSGTNALRIDTLHLDESTIKQLDKLPIEPSPDGKFLIILGTPTFEKPKMEEYTKELNTLYERLPSETLAYWTIVGNELPREYAYIALVHLEPLA